MVKNLPAYAREARDEGSIPGSGRSLKEEMATQSSILAWKILCTEEPGRLQPMGSQKSWIQLNMHACNVCCCNHGYATIYIC